MCSNHIAANSMKLEHLGPGQQHYFFIFMKRFSSTALFRYDNICVHNLPMRDTSGRTIIQILHTSNGKQSPEKRARFLYSLSLESWGNNLGLSKLRKICLLINSELALLLIRELVLREIVL